MDVKVDSERRAAPPVTLDDKYSRFDGRVYLTGIQALVRLPILQYRRDRAAGLNTAGFISGYRGSPLGGYDLALWGAKKHLDAHQIHFQPGTNEDLAATAVWGSQQVGLMPGAKYDGVFGLWYGKGPGVDRSGDVLKHASYQGTAKHGGAIALCGDDHGARSSTLAHQSDIALIHYGMPVLNPATVEELVSFGLAAWEMSRYSGAWIGMKALTDTVEGGASIPADMDHANFVVPTDFELPPEGLNIRARNGSALEVEQRHYEQRLEAAQAWVRANRLDGVAWGGARRHRFGIVSGGKAYLDVVEALRGLGLDEARTSALGIGVYKVGMVWPLEPQRLRAFAETCDEVFVVEEKRPIIEDEISTILYNLPASSRPMLTGKLDENGAPLVKAVGELDPDLMLHIIAGRLRSRIDDAALLQRIAAIKPLETGIPTISYGVKELLRPPSFCAGCPHNTSTRVPDGSIAAAGIGCHIMAAALPDRHTMPASHMGGEGATWIGQAPFTTMPHMFQNLGDGTYFHSGLLAIRATIAANVNITYKILLNGAIAMTGGQIVEGENFAGQLTGPHIAAQLAAEGVKRIALVTDDPSRHDHTHYPPQVTYHHRDDLDAVQRELREFKGVSALIYEQSCATERRRLRKRGKMADSGERLFIHSEICEGCGDCGVQSNCIAVEPEETALGRKRRINQSVCNTDLSCAKGLCPSFVTVIGGKVRARAEDDSAEAAILEALPQPTLPRIGEVYNVLLAGIGGNGVVTISALLGMAAHLEDKLFTVLDNSGLAQRNGSVTSHLRIGDGAQRHSPRIPNGDVDLVIGADPMVVAIPETLAKLGHGRSAVILNRFVAPNALFAGDPDLDLHFAPMLEKVRPRADAERIFSLDATRVASVMLGNAIGTNMLLVGFAWQSGLIPLRAENIMQAITLNGTEAAMNRRAFGLGRIAAARPELVAGWLRGHETVDIPDTLGDLLADRMPRLTAWGGARWARRYRALVAKVEAAEAKIQGADGGLSRAVAFVAAKLMTYKDEYEVARLFVDPAFALRLRETFEGDFAMQFNLAPPLFARRDKATGRPKKQRFGPWMMRGFKVLSRLRVLRGTPLDVFGYHPHRRTERALVDEYAALVDQVLARLTPGNLAAAEAVLRAHEKVRGYDVVKEANLAKVRSGLPVLLEGMGAGA
ncbi:MAG: indolepyruvate ferredoxin oxidoreductase family protein [Rhodospirillales bacterium]